MDVCAKVADCKGNGSIEPAKVTEFAVLVCCKRADELRTELGAAVWISIPQANTVLRKES